MKRTIASAVLLSFTGCSAAFVESPPPNPAATPELSCTSSYVWPIGDVALAFVSLGAAMDEWSRAHSRAQIVNFSFPVLAIASAFHGFDVISRCRRAKASRPVPPPDEGPSLVDPSTDRWLAYGPPPAALPKLPVPNPDAGGAPNSDASDVEVSP